MTIKGQRFAGKRDNLPASPEDPNTSFIPSEFADHEEKKELWLFLCEDMKKRNNFSPTYFFVMQSLVENVVLRKECLQHMEAHGKVLEKYNKNGDVIGFVPNPSFDQYSRLSLLISRDLEKMGMTPRDIVLVSHPDTTAEDAIRIVGEGSPTSGIIYFAD